MNIFAWILFILAIVDLLVSLFTGNILELIICILRVIFFVFYLFVNPGTPIMWMLWTLFITNCVGAFVMLFGENKFLTIFTAPYIVFYSILLFA